MNEEMNKRMKISWKGMACTGLLCLGLVLSAQQSEVRVVKPYSPTLSGAQKIQLLPNMEEEVPFARPEFTYTLEPKRYASQFRPEPIKGARMVKPPLRKLYKSELTMGVGNYLTPLAELNINQLRSRKGSIGVQLRHHSMNGKLKLNDELKIPAGFSENRASVYGKRFFRNAVLGYQLGTEYNTAIHYGVDTTEIADLPERDSLRHNWFLAEGGLNLHSAHADSFHFNYQADLDYYYFTHQFDQQEHGAKLDFHFHKRLRALDIAGEAGAAYYGHYPDWDTLVGNHVMAWLTPRVAKSSTNWKFTAGLNATFSTINGTGKLHVYPRGSFEFNMINQVVIPYFGVDGYLESNNYRKTAEENPFVVPSLALRPTSHKLIAFLGVKGKVTEKFSYQLKASYSIIEDQYFFVNDVSQVLKNQFSALYADLSQLNLHAELTFRPTADWRIFLKGNVYSYDVSTMVFPGGSELSLVGEFRPWNKPSWDASVQARYNMSDKFLIKLGLYSLGKRPYLDLETYVEGNLSAVVDANLGVEYRYSKLLSFWVRLDNLAAQRYYLYYQYPSYRFRGMIGFSYSL